MEIKPSEVHSELFDRASLKSWMQKVNINREFFRRKIINITHRGKEERGKLHGIGDTSPTI